MKVKVTCERYSVQHAEVIDKANDCLSCSLSLPWRAGIRWPESFPPDRSEPPVAQSQNNVNTRLREAQQQPKYAGRPTDPLGHEPSPAEVEEEFSSTQELHHQEELSLRLKGEPQGHYEGVLHLHTHTDTQQIKHGPFRPSQKKDTSLSIERGGGEQYWHYTFDACFINGQVVSPPW